MSVVLAVWGAWASETAPVSEATCGLAAGPPSDSALLTASTETAGVSATSAERSTGALARAGSAVGRTTSPSTCGRLAPDALAGVSA